MNRRLTPALLSSFLSVEGALYFFFLVLDLLGRGEQTISIKYACILLCLAFSLLGADRLVPLALALTAGADWFLLVENDHYPLGIGLFLCVQTVYLVRLRRAGADSGWPLRSALALGAGLGVYALRMASPVNLLAALYFSQLLSNTLLAWTLKGKRQQTFALGLTLFVGCDVCVGLFHVLPPASPAYASVSVGMWMFYLPSQILIALSALPEKENVK